MADHRQEVVQGQAIPPLCLQEGALLVGVHNCCTPAAEEAVGVVVAWEVRRTLTLVVLVPRTKRNALAAAEREAAAVLHKNYLGYQRQTDWGLVVHRQKDSFDLVAGRLQMDWQLHRVAAVVVGPREVVRKLR